ncbi:hypothetical protein [Hyunsoonleella ulvae]|uniref:hypothetical protein n=1 Tax=Hyunsoonleella ulvae TaxID=2799948 RepID=UPI00193A727B|nr:hypothetical protein [Hyunsoonleella ulvae]
MISAFKILLLAIVGALSLECLHPKHSIKMTIRGNTLIIEKRLVYNYNSNALYYIVEGKNLYFNQKEFPYACIGVSVEIVIPVNTGI